MGWYSRLNSRSALKTRADEIRYLINEILNVHFWQYIFVGDAWKSDFISDISKKKDIEVSNYDLDKIKHGITEIRYSPKSYKKKILKSFGDMYERILE